jgi:uncharacterized protein (DUF1778 family)
MSSTKTSVVGFRVNETDRAILEVAAKSAGLTLAEFAYRAVVPQARERVMELARQPIPEAKLTENRPEISHGEQG